MKDMSKQQGMIQLRDASTYEELNCKVLNKEYKRLENQNSSYLKLNQANVSPCGEFMVYYKEGSGSKKDPD